MYNLNQKIFVAIELPVSSPVSAKVTEVALTSGIELVGASKNAAIGIEPFGKISNCVPSLVNT